MNAILDLEVSAAVARRVRARFRRCWQNAAMAVSHFGRGAHYVEGWVVTDRTDPFVIEHGWCEVDGRIVDPSYAPRISPYPPPLAYFAGTRFGAAEAEAALCRRRLPISWRRETRVYLDAFASAWRAASRRQEPAAPPLTRVVHCRREPCDVIIARPSPWACPFYFGGHLSRELVIAKYRRWLIRQPGLLSDVWNLRGKVLGCHCAPLPCHGDVLAELANVRDDGAPFESTLVHGEPAAILLDRLAPGPQPVVQARFGLRHVSERESAVAATDSTPG